MAIRMPRIIQATQILKRSFSNGGSTPASMDIPKGYFAIYVGEQEKKRFVVPISILSESRFQELLHQSKQEFGYNHPMGGITIPSSEDVFTDLSLLVLEHFNLCRSVSF
ncbi:putative small auxin-up RNA [Helianthus annuus]|nr:putative small auxin-up RNA [Helianthus annuus]KAJ0632700.1 putative small auxin-up RNA [Helianthus annuus]KAJ0826623.1 putative small auxin-up RNA [Helianthus annuus]